MTTAATPTTPTFLLPIRAKPELIEAMESALKPALPDIMLVGAVEEIEARIGMTGARAVALVVGAFRRRDDFSDLAQIAARCRGRIFFVLIGGEIAASDYKTLIQSANADWVAESALPHEVLEIVARQAAKAAAEPARRNHPLVVSFVPSAGGVGNSTLAIEAAIQLKQRRGGKDGKTCLVDLDFHASHVCDHLDIEPRLQIDEIIGAPQRLDAQLIEIFASRHSSGLEVFAASRGRMQPRDVGVEALSALFDLIAQRYQTIVIDLPLARYSWTVPVLAASQVALVVGRNTIPGLRQAAATLAAVRGETSIAGAVRGVINGCEYSLLGNLVRGDHITRILGEEKPLFVRHADIALESVNAGTPMSLASPSAKIVRDIAALADYCAALAPAAAERK